MRLLEFRKVDYIFSMHCRNTNLGNTNIAALRCVPHSYHITVITEATFSIADVTIILTSAILVLVHQSYRLFNNLFNQLPEFQTQIAFPIRYNE
jgi:hypothetical protein